MKFKKIQNEIKFNFYAFEIDRDGEKSLFQQPGNSVNFYSGFSKINIFIGKNNSGKSKFLRTLAFRKYSQLNSNEFSYDELLVILQSLLKKYASTFAIPGGSYSISAGDNFKINLDRNNYSHYSPDLFTALKDVQKEIEKNLIDIDENMLESYKCDPLHFYKSFMNVKNEVDVVQEGCRTAVNRCYLPVLRTLRPMDLGEGSDNDLCFHRTNKDYFHDSAKPFSVKPLDRTELQIFTGREIYRDLKRMLLGKPEKRVKVRKYENFLSSTFFNSKKITLIPNEESNDIVELLIEGDKQLEIFNVGDGLGQLIIITFPIFMREISSLFFIEEPDLFMHPGMQRILIEAMLKNDQHQYFLTTHSNHLMDIALEKPDEIKLFMIQKENTEKFIVKPMTESLRQINDDLGVRNSSVLLANSSIWVEGVTDKLYLKSFMKKYLNELKANNESKYERYSSFVEDYHYIFVEYQGSNLPHFDFSEDGTDDVKATSVDRLIGNAMVLLDGDVKEKGDRVKILEDALTEYNVIVLDCKEIENLLPEEIIKPIAQDRFDNRKKRKTDGRSINLKKLKFTEYSKHEKGIGKHLDDCITGEKHFFSKNNKRNDAPGTINRKVEFCEAATELMDKGSVDFSLSEDLTNILEKIFEHIDKCNKNHVI